MKQMIYLALILLNSNILLGSANNFALFTKIKFSILDQSSLLKCFKRVMMTEFYCLLICKAHFDCIYASFNSTSCNLFNQNAALIASDENFVYERVNGKKNTFSTLPLNTSPASIIPTTNGLSSSSSVASASISTSVEQFNSTSASTTTTTTTTTTATTTTTTTATTTSNLKLIDQDCDNDEDCKGYSGDLEIHTIKCNSQKCTCEGDFIFAPSENAEPYACSTIIDGPCKEDIHCRDDKHNGTVTISCQNEKCKCKSPFNQKPASDTQNPYRCT